MLTFSEWAIPSGFVINNLLVFLASPVYETWPVFTALFFGYANNFCCGVKVMKLHIKSFSSAFYYFPSLMCWNFLSQFLLPHFLKPYSNLTISSWKRIFRCFQITILKWNKICTPSVRTIFYYFIVPKVGN